MMRERAKAGGIRQKLLRKYLYTFLTCFLAGMAVIALWTRETVYDSIRETSLREFVQIKNAVEHRVSEYYYVSYMIQNSRIVIESMQEKGEDKVGKYYAKRNIEAQLAVLTEALSLYPITLYLDKETLYQDNITFRSIEELENYPEFAEFRQNNASYIWLAPEKIHMTNLSRPVEVFPFLRKIGDNTSPIAFQKACIRKEEIQDLIALGNPDAEIFLYSRGKGLVMLREGADYFGGNEAEILLEAAQKWEEGNDWMTLRSRQGDYLYHMQRIRGTDWLIIMMIPRLFFLDGFLQIFMIWLVLFFVLAFIYRRFEKKYSANIVDRIRCLQQEMREYLEGGIEDFAKSEIAGRDELDVLGDYYKDMLGRVKALLTSRLEDEREKRRLELSLLQAQINPHFLYNTLDLINWKARDENVSEISDIACKLADFYRLSLNRGRQIIRIRDEVEQVRNYVDLQNYRFDTDIDLIIEIPEEMMDASLPKVTLQPLIENAVQHGFLVKEDREGCEIEIYGWQEDGRMLLLIRDNGEGMEAERLESLLEEQRSEQHGYGVKNIDERIKLYCGKEYGLRFESFPGGGTSVYVSFGCILRNAAE